MSSKKCFPFLFLIAFLTTPAWPGQVITVDALGVIHITYPSTISFGIGSSVAGIGDFDGDGFQDVAIGAPSFETEDLENEYDTGAVFIVFGNQLDRERGELNLSDDQYNGVTIMGHLESRIGYGLAGVLDVNGDGYSDLAIGTGEYKTGYIVFGNAIPRRLLSTQDLQNDGVEVSHTGFSLAPAGDFNGDGFSDVVFGNPETERKTIKLLDKEQDYGACRVTLVYGRTAFPPVLDSRIPNEQLINFRGFLLDTRLGEYVCGNVDMNVDGLSDLLIVAPNGGKDLQGRAFLIEGRKTVDNADPKCMIDHASRFVRNAGDVNGDGYPDLLVGYANQSTILLWGGDHFQGTLDLNSIDSRLRVILEGSPSVYAAGDINGDGFADIVVGLPHDSVRENVHAGRIVFLLGGQNWPETVDVSSLCTGALSPVEYVVVEGNQAFGAFGSSISAVGDIQKDGFSDVIVGAPFQALPGEIRLESPGSAYVIQGKSLFQSLQTRRSHFLSSEVRKDHTAIK